MQTELLTTSEEDVKRAGAILRGGGLVAFPTETVYGLGANALDDEAAAKIYAAKGRPSDNPLIVHVAHKSEVAPLVKSVPPDAKKLMDAFFPGPISIIMQKSEKIGKTVSGGLHTVAIRMPENEDARRIIAAAGVPVCAPSANTSGKPSPTCAEHVKDDMLGRIDAIVDGGACRVGVESTVVTVADGEPVILRPGAVTKEMMEKVLGKPVSVARAVTEGMKENETAASPGMKYKHYAPKAKVVIVDADQPTYEAFVNSRAEPGVWALCFADDRVNVPCIRLGHAGDDGEQAHRLFAALREFDKNGAKKVYARMPGKSGVAMAVYNRLIRAAAFDILDLNKPFTLGLTGPTGAGKSYAAKALAKRGFQIISADEAARRVTEKGSPVLKELCKAFGEDILLQNGELDRKKLAERAFAAPDKTQLLNAITHPAILKTAREARTQPLTVFDAPQLFESGAEKDCFKTVCVLAGEKTRKARIMARDEIGEEAAERRMAAQFDEAFFVSHTDFALTSEDGDDIEAQIDKILEAIL